MRCAPQASNGPKHLGLCALQVALKNESADGQSFVTAIVKEASRTVNDRIQAAAAAESRARLAEAEAERLRRQAAEAGVAQHLAEAEVEELEQGLADAKRQVRQLKAVTVLPDFSRLTVSDLHRTISPGAASSFFGSSSPPLQTHSRSPTLDSPTASPIVAQTPLASPIEREQSPSPATSPVATQSAAYTRLQQRQQRRQRLGLRSASEAAGYGDRSSGRVGNTKPDRDSSPARRHTAPWAAAAAAQIRSKRSSRSAPASLAIAIRSTTFDLFRRQCFACQWTGDSALRSGFRSGRELQSTFCMPLPNSLSHGTQ